MGPTPGDGGGNATEEPGGRRSLRGEAPPELAEAEGQPERVLSSHNATNASGHGGAGHGHAGRNASANETVGGAQVLPGQGSGPPTTTTTTTTYAGRQLPAACYFDMAAEQQMAVHALGYTINDWNCYQPCPRYNLDMDDDMS